MFGDRLNVARSMTRTFDIPEASYGFGDCVGPFALADSPGLPQRVDRPIVGVETVAQLRAIAELGKFSGAIVEQLISPYSHDAFFLWGLGIPSVTGVSLSALTDQEEVRLICPPSLVAPLTTDTHDRPEIWAEIAAVADIDRAAKADGIGVLKLETLVHAEPGPRDHLLDLARHHGGAKSVRLFDFDPRLTSSVAGSAYLGARGVRLLPIDDYLREAVDTCRSLGVDEGFTLILPMASTLEAVSRGLEFMESEGYSTGVTVETPGLAVVIDELPPTIRLIEIGLNDLSQYTMAWDRDVVNDTLLPRTRLASPVAKLISGVARFAAVQSIPCCLGLDLRPSRDLADSLKSGGLSAISAPAALAQDWLASFV